MVVAIVGWRGWRADEDSSCDRCMMMREGGCLSVSVVVGMEADRVEHCLVVMRLEGSGLQVEVEAVPARMEDRSS